jgi:hypothetical protein
MGRALTVVAIGVVALLAVRGRARHGGSLGGYLEGLREDVRAALADARASAATQYGAVRDEIEAAVQARADGARDEPAPRA